MAERRKSKRFQLRSCQIKIEKSSFLGLKSESQGKVALFDLSAEGLQALTVKQLKTGEKYNIKIITNVFSPMDIVGTVIWSKPYKSTNFEKYYRTGFSFTKLDDNYKKNLKKLEADPMLRQVTRSKI